MPALGACSIAGDGRVGPNGDPDAGDVIGIGASGSLRHQVADQVALNNGQASAVIKIRDRNSDGCAIDRVVGDHRTFEAELGMERDFAQIRTAVAGDLQI